MGGQVLELEADKWRAEMQEAKKRAEEQERRLQEQEKRLEEQEKQINYLNSLNGLYKRLAEQGSFYFIARAVLDPDFREQALQEYEQECKRIKQERKRMQQERKRMQNNE